MSVISKTVLVRKEIPTFFKKRYNVMKIICFILIFVVHILFPCLLTSFQDKIGVAF